MRSLSTLATSILGLAMMGMAGTAANAAVINEIEPNDTIATAQNIDAFFDLSFDPNIEDVAGVNTSVTISHAEVQGTGDGTTDFYSFTGQAGSLAILDIDCGSDPQATCVSAGSFDAIIFLFAPSSAPIGFNDDSGFATCFATGGCVIRLPIREVVQCRHSIASCR